MAKKVSKPSKKPSKRAQAADFEPTRVAFVVAFVAAVSIVLFAVIALWQ